MAENQHQGHEKQGSSSSNRGFAAMDEDKQRDIASKGGSSVDPEDRSFSKDHELASEAGRKGGQASHRGEGASRQEKDERSGRGGNFADNPDRASEAGRKGGER